MLTYDGVIGIIYLYKNKGLNASESGSYMIFSASASWFSGDWYEKVSAAKKYGFKAVEELVWSYLDLSRAADHLKRENITSSSLIIESTDPEINKYLEWEHGMVYEDSREPFIRAFRETVDACLKLGVPNIVATCGNERFDVEREKQIGMVVSLLSEMGKIASDSGLTVVFEPLNVIVDHMGYMVSTSKEAFDIIRRVDSPAVRVLFDIYHQQITEGNVIRNITENIDLIGHFHIADNPGRRQPGTGELNYVNIFDAIQKSGYRRYLAFECGTTVPEDEIARSMRDLIAPFED